MNPDHHAVFRFDTLAEAVCFVSSLAQIEEKYANIVELHLKGRMLQILLTPAEQQKKLAREILEQLRRQHRAG